MAIRSRMDVLRTITGDGVVPVFYDPDPDVAAAVAGAIVAGGLNTLEFTNRGAGATEVLAALLRLSEHRYPDLVVGAGSIVDAATAAHVIDLGAGFVFGPGFRREVAAACNLRNVAYVPGCGTVSEVLEAYSAGCDMVKLFPADALGGPGFLDAVRAPCPWVRAIPTGGVEPTVESLRAWYRAGAPAVGMGSKLLPKQLIAEGDFDALRTTIERAVDAARQARSQS